MSSKTRRDFLRHASALSAAAPISTLGLNLGLITQAAAQSTGGNGYRALVCLYLAGGNDAFNTVLATDSTSWAHYNNHRKPTEGGTSIALMPAGTAAVPTASPTTPEKLGGVLPISHAGRSVHADRTFALHPALTQVQRLHQSGRACVLANVGTLTRPTTKADWSDSRASKPAKLFSHNDQQSTWLSLQPEGASKGWGGLIGDLVMSNNAAGRTGSDADLIKTSFTCMTPTGSPLWLAGQSVQPYQSGVTNVLGLGSGDKIYRSTRLQSAAASIMGALQTDGTTKIRASNAYADDVQKITQRALKASSLLGSQLSPLGIAPWSTPSTTNVYNEALLKYTSPTDGTQKINPLALQLQMVARLIDTNRTANLGMTRQLFMVAVGGYDSHNNQISSHAENMAQINHALNYFDQVLQHMPGGDMSAQVTTFTASEFGRAFTSNGDGTDHGWGGHHIIMGGAVIGTEVYGTFPRYSTADSQGVFSSPDQIQNGVLIPTTSVDHYAYTLGKWMGVSDTNLRAILPNLRQFNSSTYDLGFLRA